MEHFGRCAGYQKTLKNLRFFLRFLEVLGWLDGVVRASWRLTSAMLTPRWRFMVDVGAMLSHVGSKMATKTAKMRQHRRKKAPRLAQRIPVAAWRRGWGPLRNRIPQLTN